MSLDCLVGYDDCCWILRVLQVKFLNPTSAVFTSICCDVQENDRDNFCMNDEADRKKYGSLDHSSEPCENCGLDDSILMTKHSYEQHPSQQLLHPRVEGTGQSDRDNRNSNYVVRKKENIWSTSSDLVSPSDSSNNRTPDIRSPYMGNHGPEDSGVGGTYFYSSSLLVAPATRTSIQTKATASTPFTAATTTRKPKSPIKIEKSRAIGSKCQVLVRSAFPLKQQNLQQQQQSTDLDALWNALQYWQKLRIQRKEHQSQCGCNNHSNYVDTKDYEIILVPRKGETGRWIDVGSAIEARSPRSSAEDIDCRDRNDDDIVIILYAKHNNNAIERNRHGTILLECHRIVSVTVGSSSTSFTVPPASPVSTSSSLFSSQCSSYISSVSIAPTPSTTSSFTQKSTHSYTQSLARATASVGRCTLDVACFRDKSERHALFAEWIVQYYGIDYLRSSTGEGVVLDVAGGNGQLTAALLQLGVTRITLLDPNPRISVDELLSLAFEANHKIEATTTVPITSGVVVNVVPLALSLDGSDFIDPTEHSQQNNDIISKSFRSCYNDHQNKISNNCQNQLDDCDNTTNNNNHSVIHRTLQNVTLIVGMHPDQATEAIIKLALRLQVPFAIVPCCVMPKLFPHRRCLQSLSTTKVSTSLKKPKAGISPSPPSLNSNSNKNHCDMHNTNSNSTTSSSSSSVRSYNSFVKYLLAMDPYSSNGTELDLKQTQPKCMSSNHCYESKYSGNNLILNGNEKLNHQSSFRTCYLPFWGRNTVIYSTP